MGMWLIAAAATAAAAAAPSQRARIIDAFMASSEIDMVRYRLKLHHEIAIKTIIVEAPFTHAGQPKPLLVRNSLTNEELERYKVRLVTVKFTAEALQQARCRFASLATVASSGQADNSFGSGDHEQSVLQVSIRLNRTQCVRTHTFAGGGAFDTKSLLEGQQRRAMNAAILDEIATANKTAEVEQVRVEAATGTEHRRRMPFFVHVSDVDELLDPRLVAKQHAGWPSCLPAHLRLYGFSEHCLFSTPRWMRSLIARADWLASILKSNPEAELRMAHRESIALLAAKGCMDPRHHVPTCARFFSAVRHQTPPQPKTPLPS